MAGGATPDGGRNDGRGPYVLLLDPQAGDDDLRALSTAVGRLHPGAAIARGDGWAALAVGDGIRPVELDGLVELPGVRRAVPVSSPHRLASREAFDDEFGVPLSPAGGPLPAVEVGGAAPIGIVAGSRWATGSETRLRLLAPLLAEAGCVAFHAGPATAGDGAQAGLPLAALVSARDVAHEHGLALSVEVTEARDLELVEGVADVLLVGSANMQNFSLLRELGRTSGPVLLKRGTGATVEEFLLAAEYVLSHGNGRVILCESGIRTFDAVRRPRFEINAVPLLKLSTHLPVMADPSQAAPRAEAVPALARAAVAAGADGLLLEVGAEPVHDPDATAIDVETLRRLVAELRPIARAVGRAVGAESATELRAPRDAAEILRRTDRTLGQVIESIVGVPPELEVVGQWRLGPGSTGWLSPPLSAGAEVLGRCTGYRMGGVRLSRNLSYVDLGRIGSTLAALLESKQLNLGQLFVDPKIEKLHFEFGTDEDAGEIDGVLRSWFSDEEADLRPYVWRRYQAAIRGVVSFVVIEALPTKTWDRLLERGVAPALRGSAT